MAANAFTNDRAIWINDFDTGDDDAGEGKCLILFAAKCVGNFWVYKEFLLNFKVFWNVNKGGALEINR